MSRIIVKDLPRYLNEDRLREHFTSIGEVTDVRLMRTAKGVSRRFAYIGYKAEHEAQKAISHFNGTFIDTSRIVVEQAKARNDPTLAAPLGLHSAKSESNVRGRTDDTATTNDHSHKRLNNKQSTKSDDVKTDERLQEFLQVMQPRIKSKAWANEDGRIVDARPSTVQQQQQKKKTTDVIEVANKKPGGNGMIVKKIHTKFDDDDDDASDNEEGARNGHHIANTNTASHHDDNDNDDDNNDAMMILPAQNSMAHNASVSNLDYLRSKMVLQTDLEMDVAASNEVHDTTESTEKVDETTSNLSRLDIIDTTANDYQTPEAQIMDTGRLFLRNLAYTCTEDDLRPIFAPFGPLAEVQLPIDRETKKSKGFAYITYVMPEHAVKAYQAMDRQSLQGRILHVLPAKEKPRPAASDETLSVKKAREKKRKAQAGNDFNWNTLYMNSDAVMDAIADKLGVAKAEILDPSAENMAVRMALAETQIINDTKGYLEQHGICLDAFEKKERSETVILVKNIPHGTTEEQMHGLFSKYGELGRIIVPPAQTIAIVEYLEPTEARAAFKQLAYSRYKSSLLYLEKAPLGIFTHGYHESKQAAVMQAQSTQRKADVEALLESNQTTEDHYDNDIGTSTLFIKNLNFDTTEATLRDVFAPVGQLRKVTIRRKKDPKRPGQLLSMGFGFIEFAGEDTANRALKSLQGFVVDGHALQLKISSQSNMDEISGSSTKNKASTGTKLIVRNIPFEATRKDIMELFSAYGQLKTVRLPKKYAGGHRGFAFIEFLGQQEAKNAMKHLTNTHLYGRHLVIEAAEDIADLDVMRKRVDEQYEKLTSAAASASKRRRLDMDGILSMGGEDAAMSDED